LLADLRHIGSFLPCTIHFAVPAPARRHSRARRPSSSAAGNSKGESLSLFNSYGGQEHTQTTPPATPAATADHEEFFSRNRPSAVSSSLAQPYDSHSSPLSDPHSPEWGSGRNFNQPRSRALSPPPASILKHAKGHGRLTHNARAERKTTKGTSQPSYDSVFASAPWTVEQADQSNGGLQKAVGAACKAGTLKEKTWVSAPSTSRVNSSDSLPRWAHWACQ